ncbi:MAG: NUDIX domain-containing protein [Patescibacteria group bacterium]|jgi:ADP-ribose pyrophosphatase YjhB (NUDIX family)
MKTFATVHAIAQNIQGEILVLQRAKMRERAGKWNCVTGFIKERESAEDAALRELKEETGLVGALVKTAKPHWVDHDGARWILVPSLIRVTDTSSLQIDALESQSYRWILPTDPDVKKMISLNKSLELLGLLPNNIPSA